MIVTNEQTQQYAVCSATPTEVPSQAPELIGDAREQTQTGCSKTAIPPDVPVFLQKTYHMIDTCDDTVASWSDDGKTFIIRDPEKLASKIIPQFFKHSKFSSFVRQLNFYGFRKVKLDPLKGNIGHQEGSKFWRFHHEHFQRGHPSLLQEIRKSSQNTVEREEVEALKREVMELKAQVASMSQFIQGFMSIASSSMSGNCRTLDVQEEMNHKRRKIEPQVPLSSHLIQPETPASSFTPEIPASSTIQREDLEPSDFSDEELLVEDVMPDPNNISVDADFWQVPNFGQHHNHAGIQPLDEASVRDICFRS